MNFVFVVAATYIRCRFFLCIVCFFNAQAYAQSFYLHVYPIISIDKQVHGVTVQKLARLTYDDGLAESDVARINATEVELPLIGLEQRQYLRGEDIKSALISALGEKDRMRVVVNVPPRVVVRTKTDIDMSSSAVGAARKKLQNHLDKYYQNVVVDLVAAPSVNHRGALKYIPRKIAEPIKSRMAVWVDIFSAGELVQSAPVWFEVKADVDVFVFNSAVTRGEEVDRKHFAVRLKNIAALPSEAIRVHALEGNSFGNLVYGDDIAKGEILDRRFLQKAAAINFGETVKVTSKVGSVIITASAIAQGRADIGEKIKLITAGSKEIYWGKVVARKQAVVEANP